MIDPKILLERFSRRGFGPFTGVPCSILNPLIQALQTDSSLSYLAATSEGEAMGLAAGFSLTGALPIVLMQNSGLGNAINPLTSLQLMYELPVLLLISLRGEVGTVDAPEHKIMGQITEKLLKLLNIQYEYLTDSNEGIDEQLVRIYKNIKESRRPFATIIRKNDINSFPMKGSTGEPNLIARKEAIRSILSALQDQEVVVATTGKISRELYDEKRGATDNFYMLGSMGCAPSIALGVALRRQRQKVVVLDGDGALLMKMGTLATVGHYSPENFIHILFDNESYESTGGQLTVSSTVNFYKIADSVGYKTSVLIRKKQELISTVEKALKTRGPHFIHIKVLKGSDPNLDRVGISPSDIKENFMNFLKKANE